MELPAIVAGPLDSIPFFQFRNSDHFIWFISTVVIFLASTSVYLYHIVVSENTEWSFFRFVPLCLMGGYLYVAGASYRIVFVEFRNSSVYSADCVWFNTVAALCYFGLFLYGTIRFYLRL